MKTASTEETVLAFGGPGDTDWVVSVVQQDGRAWSRRVNPGTVSEEAALGFALVSSGVKPHEVDRWSIRRAGDRQIVLDDPFAALLRRRA
jgi:hypothetical protein